VRGRPRPWASFQRQPGAPAKRRWRPRTTTVAAVESRDLVVAQPLGADPRLRALGLTTELAAIYAIDRPEPLGCRTSTATVFRPPENSPGNTTAVTTDGCPRARPFAITDRLD